MGAFCGAAAACTLLRLHGQLAANASTSFGELYPDAAHVRDTPCLSTTREVMKMRSTEAAPNRKRMDLKNAYKAAPPNCLACGICLGSPTPDFEALFLFIFG